MSVLISDTKYQELVSVVIPIYNPGEYLWNALESLKNQTYSNFEAIMVDDGSTDASQSICHSFVASDKRFRYFYQSNAGVSVARNNGVDMANGKWIVFMDADDLMPCDALTNLVNAVLSTGVKISVGKFIRGILISRERNDEKYEVLTTEAAIVMGLYQKRILNSPCGTLFHSSILKGEIPVRFRNCRYEDLDFFYRAYERTDKICLINNVVYFYRDNPDSFINTWSEARLDALEVTDRLAAHFADRSQSLRKASMDRRFSAHFNILLLMLRNGTGKAEHIRKCMEVIRSQRADELKDSNVRIKNKLGALISYLGMPAMKILCKWSH